MIGFVSQIGDHRQFFLLHLRRYLLQNFSARDLVRQRGNNYITLLFIPQRPHAHGPSTRGVEFSKLFLGGDNFRIGWHIRAWHKLTDIL